LILGEKSSADETNSWRGWQNPIEFQFQSPNDYKGVQTIQFGKQYGKFIT
jgi:hypothetical protein